MASEELETRLEQERKSPLPRCVTGLSDGVGCQGRAALPPLPAGVWRWSGLCHSRGLKEAALFSITGVGAVAYAPLCAPGLGWPCAQSRDLSLQGSGLPAVPTLKTRGPFQKSKYSRQLGRGLCPKQTGRDTVGQAGPLSLFGEGIRPSGFVGLSAARVGGGCRPSQGHGETNRDSGECMCPGCQPLGVL